MDTISVAYYATVCAILSLAAPRLGRRFVRLAVGAAVGLVAAAILPMIRTNLGGW